MTVLLPEPPRSFPFSENVANWKSSDSNEFSRIKTIYTKQPARNLISAGSHGLSAACFRLLQWPQGLSNPNFREACQISAHAQPGREKKLRKFKDDPSASRRHANIDTPDEHWLSGCYLETESTWFLKQSFTVFSQCSCSVGGKKKKKKKLEFTVYG